MVLPVQQFLKPWHRIRTHGNASNTSRNANQLANGGLELGLRAAIAFLLPALRGEGGRRPDEGQAAGTNVMKQTNAWLFVARVSLAARPGITAGKCVQ